MKKYAFLSLLAVLALGACDDDDDPTSPATATVRVVNATTATTGTNNFTTVSLFRSTNGTNQIAGGVAAGVNTSTVNASACSPVLTVPAGQHTLAFRATGASTNAATVQHTFEAGKRYTVVLYGNNNTVQAKVFNDETFTNAAANTRRIRFINASSNTTAMDIYALATTTTAVGTTAATATSIAAANASGYFNIANASPAFRAFNTGGTTTEQRNFALTTTGFPTSGNATVFFTDAGAFQVNACS